MKKEHQAWLAVGIFAAIVLGYFWLKNQVNAANLAGYNQAISDEEANFAQGFNP